ncbi:MAG: hypothetical protein MJE66_08070 [Proteobacteria bacterium]|nr:hypothetical protein [Pseudomonadota bacterium]
MRAIDLHSVWSASDLAGYTREEVEEFAAQLDYLEEEDGDALVLRSEDRARIQLARAAVAARLGGPDLAGMLYRAASEQVERLFHGGEWNRTSEKIVLAIENVLALLDHGRPIHEFDFQMLPPPPGYEAKWLAIKSFPDPLTEESPRFAELEAIQGRALTDAQKREAVAFSAATLRRYQAGKQRTGG